MHSLPLAFFSQQNYFEILLRCNVGVRKLFFFFFLTKGHVVNILDLVGFIGSLLHIFIFCLQSLKNVKIFPVVYHIKTVHRPNLDQAL